VNPRRWTKREILLAIIVASICLGATVALAAVRQ
jgi:hypothetical protein